MNSLKSFSDNDLVQLAQSGRSDAEEELIARYKKKACICARKFYILGGDDEDLIQEAMIGLLNAVRTFDVMNGACFGTYSEKCIKARLIDVISLKRYTAFFSLEERAAYDTEPFSVNDPESIILDKENEDEFAKKIRTGLSSYEQTVLDRYLQGMSCQEIADTLNKAVSSVYNAIQRIRSKISASIFSGDSGTL